MDTTCSQKLLINADSNRCRILCGESHKTECSSRMDELRNRCSTAREKRLPHCTSELGANPGRRKLNCLCRPPLSLTASAPIFIDSEAMNDNYRITRHLRC